MAGLALRMDGGSLRLVAEHLQRNVTNAGHIRDYKYKILALTATSVSLQ